VRSEKPLLSDFSARPGSPPDASSRLPEHHRIGYTEGNALAIRPRRHGVEKAESKFENGSGAGTRTPAPGASSAWHYKLAIRLGPFGDSRRARKRHGEARHRLSPAPTALRGVSGSNPRQPSTVRLEFRATSTRFSRPSPIAAGCPPVVVSPDSGERVCPPLPGSLAFAGTLM
jgi:hypothetical protein